jgi:hypothetical protein
LTFFSLVQSAHYFHFFLHHVYEYSNKEEEEEEKERKNFLLLFRHFALHVPSSMQFLHYREATLVQFRQLTGIDVNL